MLVFLDRSLLSSMEANPSPFAPTVVAIELAAEAARQGSHILCGDIATFDSLVANDALSERTRMLLARARTKTPYRQELTEAMLWYVRITDSVNQPIAQINTRGQTEILLPAAVISAQGSLLNRPKFIPENDNDGHFYEALTYRLIDVDPLCKRHFSSVKLKFELVQGGGDTTAAVYANVKASKANFCLAVVDSDQTYPEGPLGGTAKKVVAVDSAPNNTEWNARSIVLPVRAVENVFSKQDFLRAARELDNYLGEKARCIVSSHAGKPHWIYLPFKKGVKCFDVKNKTSPEEKYLCTATQFTACPNRSANPCKDREACETYLIDSLGTNLLAQLCSQKPIALQLNPVEDGNLVLLLKELCREMISAFCGDEPVLGS